MTEHICGITIKGRWERDALRQGIRLFLESHPPKVADLGSDFGLARRIAKHPGLTAMLVPNSNTMEDRTPLWHNHRRQVGAGRPPSRHQVVSGVAPSKSCRFGLRFWSCQIVKHPGLTAILDPNSNTMADRTPLWHNNQRQVGAGRPPARHQVVSGVAPSKSCPFWAEILGLSDCKTPWLDSHTGPRFRYHGGQSTFVA